MKRYRKGFWGLLADIHQDFRFEISGALFVVGLLLVFLAVLGYVPQARAWARGVAVLDNILVAFGPWIFWEAIVALLVVLLLLAAFSEATFGRAVALGGQGFGLALLVALVFIFDEPFNGQSAVSPEPIVTVVAEMQTRTE